MSLCDYYAESLYGTNTNVTQLRLMQSIIVLAFSGPFTLQNVDPALTGMYSFLRSRRTVADQIDKVSGILEHTMAFP